MAIKKVTNEPVSYTEIGTYLHKTPGQARVKTYTSVNKPLQVDDADITEKVQKLRVEVHVKEDKIPTGSSIYEKTVDAIQISDSTPMSNSTELGKPFTTNSVPGSSSSSDGPSELQVLKNFVDNIAQDLRIWKVIAICAGAVAIAGFVIAVIK